MKPGGFTFELTVPLELEDEADDLMEQLAMDDVADPEEIERRVEAWLECKAMEAGGCFEEED